MSSLILPDLKTDFLNSSRFAANDIARVLMPISDDTRFLPPGRPLLIGTLPELITPGSRLNVSDSNKFLFTNPQNCGSIIKTDAMPQNQSLLVSFYDQLVTCIPEEQITHIDLSLFDDWHRCEAGEKIEPHLDNGSEYLHTFTVTAAFPNPTVFYPDLSAGDYLAWYKKDPLPPEMSSEYSPDPGHMVLWNDHRAPHRAPVNTRSLAEWQDLLKNYPDSEKMLLPNGSIRRIFIRAIIQVKNDWVLQVMNANQMKLEMV